MALALSVIALLLAGVALWLSLRGSQAPAGNGLRQESAKCAPEATEQLPAETLALRQEVAALQAELGQSLRHLAVVRYDAFEEMGGELSWTLALADDAGSGVVLSTITGRDSSRTYAKNLSDWQSTAQLSEPEQTAIDEVRQAGPHN